MKRIHFFLSIVLFIIMGFQSGLMAQAADSSFTQDTSANVKWYKGKLVKTLIVPSVLIGYGVSVIKDNGFYSSYEAKNDIQRKYSGFHTNIDDWLIYVPYAELAFLNLIKVKCKNDFINTSLIILKSELLVAALVFPMKKITHQLRPNGTKYNSFPSGHTAEAFMAASIIHKEYQGISVWPGVIAYTFAASVGAFRMLNNAHWQSDVFAGAGIGILSVHLVYLTHKHKWGRQATCVVPNFNGGTKGLTLLHTF